MADHSEKKDTIVTSAGRESVTHAGAVNTPVYRASTILYPDVATLDAHAMPFTYGRRGNPTVRSLEEAVGQYEIYRLGDRHEEIYPALGFPTISGMARSGQT